MSIRDYSQYVKRVITWNEVASKLKTEYNLDDIKNQKDRVTEELNEAYAALDKNDRTELRDAICDIFVTAVYLDYMVNNDANFFKRYRKSTSTMYKEEYIRPALDKIAAAIEIDSYDKLAYYVFRLCESIKCDIKQDITLVLDNNDSKFLKDLETAQESVEMYRTKGEDVRIHHSVEHSMFVLLRNSDNKVMKPKGFVSVSLV